MGSCAIDTTMLKSGAISAELLIRFALVTLIQEKTYSRDLSQGLADPSCSFYFTLARPDLPPHLPRATEAIDLPVSALLTQLHEASLAPENSFCSRKM